ncbi:MAG: hypothetical protein ACREKI_06110 [Gemmatimonadota bacterium]
MRRAPALLLCLCLFAQVAAAQEPIFVTPPVTLYESGGVVGLDFESRGATRTMATEVAFGVRPPWTVSLHAVGVDAPGGPFEVARLHLGTRVRLLKVDRSREWVLLSAYGAGALPLGEGADRAAEDHGIPEAVLGLSFARMARRGDAFADLSVTRIQTPDRALTAAAVGLAIGWRPNPAGYGDLEAQLFAEARGQYLEGGSASIGVAPGVLLHSRKAVLKAGVLLPAWTRKASKDATLRMGIKLLL